MNNCASLLRESQVSLKWEGAEDKISVSKDYSKTNYTLNEAAYVKL